MIFKSVSAVLVLGLFVNTLASQDTLKSNPIANLVGPASSAPGKLVIIKTTGSIGVDPKIKCLPDNDDWYIVKFPDNSVGVVFATTSPGTYTFILALNSNNKTALNTYSITIAQPDPFLETLKLASKADGATKNDLQTLAAIYKGAITVVLPKCKTYGDVQNAIHTAIEAVIPGKLPSVRLALSKSFLSNFPGVKADDPVDLVKLKTQLEMISDYLEKI